jgi:putative addiction module component (TIGR02574 family)
MLTSVDDLITSALALPPETRADLVGRLLDSLAETDRPQQSDDEIAREVERRSAEMDSGEVAGIPWSEVRAELRARISRNAAQ